MQTSQNRRRFLAMLSSAGVAGVVGATHSFAQQAPPEITTVRLAKVSGICVAPQYVADELLRAEGFTDVQYPKIAAGAQVDEGLARGAADFSVFVPFEHMLALDMGAPITVLAGVHVGCFDCLHAKGFTKSPI